MDFCEDADLTAFTGFATRWCSDVPNLSLCRALVVTGLDLQRPTGKIESLVIKHSHKEDLKLAMKGLSRDIVSL